MEEAIDRVIAGPERKTSLLHKPERGADSRELKEPSPTKLPRRLREVAFESKHAWL